MERTLIIVKPEGVQRGLVGKVINRFEERGLKFVGLKLMQITPELAEKHYGVHKGKPFYPGLVQHITSSPVVVGVLEGPKAISVVLSASARPVSTKAPRIGPNSVPMPPMIGPRIISIEREILKTCSGKETESWFAIHLVAPTKATSWAFHRQANR